MSQTISTPPNELETLSAEVITLEREAALAELRAKKRALQSRVQAADATQAAPAIPTVPGSGPEAKRSRAEHAVTLTPEQRRAFDAEYVRVMEDVEQEEVADEISHAAALNLNCCALAVGSVAAHAKLADDRGIAMKAQEAAMNRTLASMTPDKMRSPSEWPSFFAGCQTYADRARVTAKIKAAWENHFHLAFGTPTVATSLTAHTYVVLKLIDALTQDPSLVDNQSYLDAVACINTEAMCAILAMGPNGNTTTGKNSMSDLRTQAQGLGFSQSEREQMKQSYDRVKFMNGKGD